jgi:polyhydroxybutyrate depolymerase
LTGDSIEFLTHDGVERRYVLHVPTDLPPEGSVPLVLVLHGAGGVPEQIIAGSGWNALADERSLIVAYPAGDDESWNAGACCGVAASEGHDDVGFLNALIAHLTGFAQVDPARVIVVGHSNGGMMAYRLACDPEVRVMGAASVAGTNMAGCQPARALSFLEIHGTSDVIVPYDGGSTPDSESVGLPPFTPVSVSIDWLVDALSCADGPVDTTASRVTTTTWTCAEGARLQLVTLGGAGHSWPTGRGFEATTAIADFFFSE